MMTRLCFSILILSKVFFLSLASLPEKQTLFDSVTQGMWDASIRFALEARRDKYDVIDASQLFFAKYRY